MMRLGAVVLERDERQVLRTLGRLGVVHLLKAAAGPDTAPLPPPDRSEELARCDALLARVQGLRQRLAGEIGDAPLFPAKTKQEKDQPEIGERPLFFPPVRWAGSLPPPVITLDEVEASVAPLEARAQELLARELDLRQKLGQVRGMLEQVEPFQDTGVPLVGLSESPFLHFAFGSLPAGTFEDLRRKVPANAVLLPLAARGDQQPLVVITSRKARYALDAQLKEAGFRQGSVPALRPCSGRGEQGRSPGRGDATATLGTLFADSRRDAEGLEVEWKQAADAVAAMVSESSGLIADLEGVLVVERHVTDAEQNFPRTERTVLITGWAPEAALQTIEPRLAEVTRGRWLLRCARPDDVPEGEIPVLLRHGRLLRPFLMLVENYGLPTYREIEPTVLMAVSWVIMFGMMFGDAGNGAVVAAGGLWLLLRGKTMTMRDSGLLLLMAGLSSVAFGIYYGSYFGVTEIGGHELGHDPLKGNPMNLMIAAVALGVVIISVGLVLNIINRFRRGDLVGGLLGKFGVAGAVFYWGVLALLLEFSVFREAGLVVPMLILVIAVPLLAIAVKEPLHFILSRRRAAHEGHGGHGGSLSEACIESAVEAFDTVLAFLANTISFVRLAAYAMAHAAVLLASFAIAEQIQKGAGPVIGGALGLLVIIGGNVIAILLEGIVASVQALRLEYYEFFGKFFSGSGQAFKPFRLSVF
jgi:V/A-type H+-transporting ATPase subunit I